jgi:glutathione synthase/RimK-type ligase-like ATP-grasp enzyme
MIFIFRSHSPLAESLAAAAHFRGCKLLNEYPATMKVRDKVLTCTMLLQAGIPTPRTFVTDNIENLRSVVREVPVVVKPYKGRRGQGIEICMTEGEFDRLVESRRGSSEDIEDDGGEDGSALGDS